MLGWNSRLRHQYSILVKDFLIFSVIENVTENSTKAITFYGFNFYEVTGDSAFGLISCFTKISRSQSKHDWTFERTRNDV